MWCDTFLRIVLSSILNPSGASMIMEDKLIIPTPGELESRGALHHVCGVEINSIPDAGMTVLLT